jgi:hypothetical protein
VKTVYFDEKTTETKVMNQKTVWGLSLSQLVSGQLGCKRYIEHV